MVGTLPAAEASHHGASDAAAEQARAARRAARQAALARALEAEQEAAAAAQEQEAAAARAAAERKEDAPSDDEDGDDSSTVDSEPPATPDPLLLHEAAVLLNLHAQAVAVQSIRSLIPVVLDVNSGSYSRWREQFLTFGKYSLQTHIFNDHPAAPSADWIRMDCVVRSWLYGTLFGDFVDIVMARSDGGATARSAWLAIEAQFLGNREARALILDAKFRTFCAG